MPHEPEEINTTAKVYNKEKNPDVEAFQKPTNADSVKNLDKRMEEIEGHIKKIAGVLQQQNSNPPLQQKILDQEKIILNAGYASFAIATFHTLDTLDSLENIQEKDRELLKSKLNEALEGAQYKIFIPKIGEIFDAKKHTALSKLQTTENITMNRSEVVVGKVIKPGLKLEDLIIIKAVVNVKNETQGD
ncbi:MAG: nucleotide exchange factor GrpE [Micrococcaceae bacterium]